MRVGGYDNIGQEWLPACGISPYTDGFHTCTTSLLIMGEGHNLTFKVELHDDLFSSALTLWYNHHQSGTIMTLPEYPLRQ